MSVTEVKTDRLQDYLASTAAFLSDEERQVIELWLRGLSEQEISENTRILVRFINAIKLKVLQEMTPIDSARLDLYLTATTRLMSQKKQNVLRLWLQGLSEAQIAERMSFTRQYVHALKVRALQEVVR